MRENFVASLARVLVHEGGWSDHPADPGGATMRGITLATFRSYYRNNRLSKSDLRAITDEQIAEIYRKRYWDAVRGDDLPAGVDYAVFDFGVNSGPSRSIKALQKVVGVTQDGAIGPVTLAAVARKPAGPIISELCSGRLAWLQTLKTYPTFGRGWKRRVEEVQRDALAMMSSPPTVRPVTPIAAPTVILPQRAPQPDEEPSGTQTAGGASSGSTGLLAALWAWLVSLVGRK